MVRTRNKVFGGWLLVCSALTAGQLLAAEVQFTAETNDSELDVGETATITVKALVEEPATGEDGIFTFDLDLILSNWSVLSIVPGTMNRLDVDDHSFGGSDGTLVPWGINAIAGGYWDLDQGIGTPQTLFTVDVEAIAPGDSTATAGPDTDIMGADFVLNETTTPTISYGEAGTMITVVPEPSTLCLFALSIGFLCSRWLTRRKT